MTLTVRANRTRYHVCALLRPRTEPDAVKFAMNCDDKVIYGERRQTSSECDYFTTFDIIITLADTYVSFYDSNCGTLTLSNEDIASDIDAFYVCTYTCMRVVVTVSVHGVRA